MAGNKKTRSQHVLKPGISGFLLTCNFRERQAVVEAYHLLNEAKDRLDAAEMGDNAKLALATEAETVVEDVEAELGAELAALKKERSFHQVQTNCKNTLFIKTFKTKWTPQQLMDSIFEDIDTNRTHKCRYICKFVPISSVVHATAAQIKSAVEALLKQQSEVNATFRIEIKVRCNSGINKEELINQLGVLVNNIQPGWTVNLDNPELVIYVDVLHLDATLAILKDFNRYRKYNLVEYATKIVGEGPPGLEEKPDSKQNGAEVKKEDAQDVQD